MKILVFQLNELKSLTEDYCGNFYFYTFFVYISEQNKKICKPPDLNEVMDLWSICKSISVKETHQQRSRSSKTKGFFSKVGSNWDEWLDLREKPMTTKGNKTKWLTECLITFYNEKFTLALLALS